MANPETTPSKIKAHLHGTLYVWVPVAVGLLAAWVLSNV